MAFNILDIIKTANIKEKAIIVNEVISTTDIKLSRTFLDAIRAQTRTLSNVDCADNIVNNSLSKVGDFVDENLKFKNIIKNVGIIGDFGTLDNNFLNFVCFIINSNFKTLTAFIESILKILLNILKKIDKLRTKVQKALLDFSKEMRDCFIRIVLDAKFGLEKIVRSAVDFNGVLDLFKQCDCIMEIVQEKFTKCKGLTTPEEVIICLRTEYALSPENIINNLNQWTKNVLTDNINFGFNVIDESIQNLLESLILPLRALVKEYCKELNKKHNFNFMLAKDPSIRCLFEFTEEFDKAGNKYFGMSIIDMLNTMKKWSGCIDFVCSSLHDEIRRKVQDYNEQLKLDFKFWNDEITLDIYFACIASNLESQNIRPTAIREIYAKNKGKGVLTQIIDFYKDIGKFTVESSNVTEPVTLGEAVTKVLNQTDSDEDDLSIVDGVELFRESIEPLVLRVYENLGKEIKEDFYYRKILELGSWDFRFKKSNDYIKVKRALQSSFQKPIEIETKAQVATTEVSTSLRTSDVDSYASPVIPKLNTFTTINDYADYNFGIKPDKRPNETLDGLYNRWFQQAV